MRRAASIAAATVLLAALVVPVADGRRHRLRLPAAQLPHGLTVDEFEWGMRPSKTVVAAGVVRLRVYNRGEDDHNALLTDHAGTPFLVSLKPGEAGTISPRLRPGRYKIICSLFAGTADSHEDHGMKFTLTVR